MSTLILDSSYLHGVGIEKIHSLCGEHQVLMPEALFMELLDDDEPAVRAACFKKFPPTENPVELIDHVGALLKYERDHHLPATPVYERRRKIRFEFNKGLTAPEFVLRPEERQTMQEWRDQLKRDVDVFKKRCSEVYKWFPELVRAGSGRSREVIEKIKGRIAVDLSLVQRLYGQIASPPFPPQDIINHDWALFRRMQVHLIAAIEYTFQFGAGNWQVQSGKLENTVLDQEYSILGILAGGLATRDGQIKKTFKLLCPKGVLME